MALIRQLHDGVGGGHDLGQGGQVEDGVRGHVLGAGRQGALAEGLAVDDLPLVPHQDDGPGNVAGGDLFLGHLAQAGKTAGVDLRGLGGRRGGGSTMTGGSGFGGAPAQPARPRIITVTMKTNHAPQTFLVGIEDIVNYSFEDPICR